MGLAELARNHLLNAYQSEHLAFIESGLMPEYSKNMPYPNAQDSLEAILARIPAYPLSEVATCYGSISLEARLARCILDLILSSHSLRNYLSSIFESSEIFMHLAPAARVIYPGNTVAMVPNHIDIGYNSHIKLDSLSNSSGGPTPLRFVTGWIPLQGKAITHGGLRVYPGLFKNETEMINRSTSLWLKSICSPFHASVVPDYEPGDCILFHPNLVHGSAPNASAMVEEKMCEKLFRVSLDVRFFSIASKTTNHYMSLSTGDQFAPGEGPCAN